MAIDENKRSLIVTTMAKTASVLGCQLSSDWDDGFGLMFNVPGDSTIMPFSIPAFDFLQMVDERLDNGACSIIVVKSPSTPDHSGARRRLIKRYYHPHERSSDQYHLFIFC